MKKLIAFFEHNGVNFLIFLHNKEICFFKKNKDGELVNVFSRSEYKTLMAVYNSIKIDNDSSMFIKKITVNGHLYDLLYDRKSHNYFWNSCNNIDSEENNIFLSFRYNHQPDILYDNGTKEQITKEGIFPTFYNKVLNLGMRIITISVAAAISLNLLTGCSLAVPPVTTSTEAYVKTTETTAPAAIETTTPEPSDISTIPGVEAEEAEKEKIEYNWEDVKQAIENNPNLSDEEKQLITSLKFVFDKDNQYMNLDMIIERLRTLQIQYGFTVEELDGATGNYTLTENIIRIAAPSFEDACLSTIIHELGHVFQEFLDWSFLFEWSNEKWTIEVLYKLYCDNLVEKKLFLSPYWKEKYKNGELSFQKKSIEFLRFCVDTFSHGYYTYIPLYCILADLLPQESLLEYHYSCANDKVGDSLVQIDVHPEICVPTAEEITRALALINSIDELRSYDYNTRKYQYSKDLSQVLAQLDYYYTKLNEKGINEIPEYNIIFAVNSTLGYTGDYFPDAYTTFNSFFSHILSLKYASYSTPDVLLVKSYFGYTSNDYHLGVSTFEPLPFDTTLSEEYLDFMSTNSVSKPKH